MTHDLQHVLPLWMSLREHPTILMPLHWHIKKSILIFKNALKKFSVSKNTLNKYIVCHDYIKMC